MTRFRTCAAIFTLLGLALLVVACSSLTEDVIPRSSDVVVEGFPNDEMLELYAVPNGTDAIPGAAGEDIVKLIYQTIKYPAEARAKGLTGAATATVTVGTRGEILDITTVRLKPEELDPDHYIVVVGYSDQPKKAVGLDNGIFSDEVLRTIKEIGTFSTVIVDGVPGPYKLQMGFKFMLQQ